MKDVVKVILLVIIALAGLLAVIVAAGMIRYSPEYVIRWLRWRESTIDTYRELFPPRPVEAPAEPFLFDEAPGEADRVAALTEEILDVPDLDAFMTATGAEAFIVVQDDTILFEGYYNGASRDTLMTSYSAAKSFVTALIGAAIADGYIDSVDDPITDYLPELAERDERFEEITIRHLMLMASGLDYQEIRPGIFNSDDMLSTYYPDQREAALEFTEIVDPPGQYFNYNKYHPQLLGLILERTTGVPVARYLEEKIWQPIGMEYDGSWSMDSEESGFEKMETGVNAAAIDFAKFGRLYLHDGNWEEEQVLPAEWVRESTQVDPSLQSDSFYPDEFGQQIYRELNGYYKYMWYGFFRGEDGYDFMAEGDRGQFIYVSPENNIIIVRNGAEWGIPSAEWVKAFYRLAGELGTGG
jgi:CubicO group peptidase (beta-lactamase class C family)